MAKCNANKSWKSQPSSTSYRNIVLKTILIYTIIASLLCAVTFAQDQYEEKRNTANTRPFHMGSRYGRSGQSPPQVSVVPRNDRFFMGSRYGKRASLLSAPEFVDDFLSNDVDESPNQLKIEAFLEGKDYSKAPALSCSYLGFGNLYRCSHRTYNMGPSR